ncbi:hypothetical protein PT283_01570 [Acetobacteraceae bacterium ESL0697]|nr:hypothetical protein [Acetobacteraceae bacterium ESL0697]
MTAFISLAGCSPAQSYLDKGFILAQAGFKAHYADTTARYTMMNYLPPGKLTYRLDPHGKRIYLYADPVACSCVYIGSEASYQNLMGFVENTKKDKYKHYSVPLTSMIVENRQNTEEWDWSIWNSSADPGGNQPKHVLDGAW